MHSVLLPQDSVCSSPEHYLKVHYERHGNLLIQPETRDTIWIEKGGVWVNPDRQTIESNTSCQMRWQWQYYAWHKIIMRKLILEMQWHRPSFFGDVANTNFAKTNFF